MIWIDLMPLMDCEIQKCNYYDQNVISCQYQICTKKSFWIGTGKVFGWNEFKKVKKKLEHREVGTIFSTFANKNWDPLNVFYLRIDIYSDFMEEMLWPSITILSLYMFTSSTQHTMVEFMICCFHFVKVAVHKHSRAYARHTYF